MRKLLFVMLFAVLATPSYAQQLASVQVTAHLRIPDFLTMRMGETTNVTTTSRRVTVYVNANRAWQLSVSQECTNDCASLRWRVVSGGQNTAAESVRVVGTNGTDIPVVIEYSWDDGDTPPSADKLQYFLTTG